MRAHRTDVAARPLHRGEPVLVAHAQAAARGRRRSGGAVRRTLAHAARVVRRGVAGGTVSLRAPARGDRGESVRRHRGRSDRELLDPRADAVATAAGGRRDGEAAPRRARADVARVRDGAGQSLLRGVLRRGPGPAVRRARRRALRQLARSGPRRPDAQPVHGARSVPCDREVAAEDRRRDDRPRLHRSRRADEPARALPVGAAARRQRLGLVVRVPALDRAPGRRRRRPPPRAPGDPPRLGVDLVLLERRDRARRVALRDGQLGGDRSRRAAGALRRLDLAARSRDRLARPGARQAARGLRRDPHRRADDAGGVLSRRALGGVPARARGPGPGHRDAGRRGVLRPADRVRAARRRRRAAAAAGPAGADLPGHRHRRAARARAEAPHALGRAPRRSSPARSRASRSSTRWACSSRATCTAT